MPLARLTKRGQAVMLARLPVRLMLPPTTLPAAAGERRGGRDRSAGRGPRNDPAPAESLDAAAQQVFEALRQHRLDLAREEKVPPYVVASDRTLRDLARLRPRNLQELGLAHRIGPAKVERYGAGLLKAIAAAG